MRFQVVHVLLFTLGVVLPTSLSAQSSHEHRWGIGAGYFLPGGDFGAYWNSSPGVVGTFLIPLEPPVLLSASASFAYFPVRNSISGTPLPTISLVILAGDVMIRQQLSADFRGNIGAGLGNYTFIYSDIDPTLLEKNDLESEVGVRLIAMIELMSIDGFELAASASSNTMFSRPERIHLWQFSLQVFF